MVEYFLVLALVIVVIVFSGFTDTVRNAFYNYFDRGVTYLK